ncbi:BON domain-containing protein [Oceanicella sp. SM1341]|uniref:BON domain-containing protein n=1 Tax=Oceanicella sp. SM1341 TaxID=1548889 RepID=UPI000E52903A|nr:BON domain-containing protein [Oceanicella sp. SM1341]
MRKTLILAAGLGLCGCTANPVASVMLPTLGVTSLQERDTVDALLDTQTQLRINFTLLGESEPMFTALSTEVYEGHVLVTGELPTAEDRAEAIRLIWTVPTVRRVTDAIAVGEGEDAGAYLDDVRITTELRSRLLTDGDVRSLNFNIETVRGTVHLMGLAESDRELERVVYHAARVPGVVRVVSHVYLYDDPQRRMAGDPASS